MLIDSILTSNKEDFSANLAEIKFFGSDDYPPKNDKWVNLHSIYPQESENIHHLEINTEHYKTMFRYLKVVMVGKESNELYCTLTTIEVFGKPLHKVLSDTLRDDIKQIPNSSANDTYDKK